jgi:hypothetical protein
MKEEMYKKHILDSRPGKIDKDFYNFSSEEIPFLIEQS